MQDLFGSVRRSLVFRTQGRDDGGGGFGGLVEKIGTSIRKSRIGLFSKPPVRALPSVPKKNDTPPIRWRKGELNGCGAFGRVYMGMNLDSGELLAVKQVLIAANSASKEKTQVIRMYTKQLSLGLEYLHKNEIIRRDIKDANILVDIKECIKLADFGASKKVVELVATEKPPWSQKYQEVVALFHIGTTKSLPPIPQHLSVEAKDFSVEMLTRVKL